MDNMHFEILDSNNEKDLTDYEKFIFYSIKNVGRSNKWVFDRFHTIENQLKSRIDYQDLMIFLCKLGNEIIISQATNCNFNQTILEKIGFNKKLILKNVKKCEGLYLCSNAKKLGFEMLNTLQNFKNFYLKKIREKNFQFIYGTCNEKYLRMHNLMGFKELSTIDYDNGKELLLELNLARAF